MVEGIIFDADGTLIDSMPGWMTVFERYLVSAGKKPEDGLREKFFRMSLNEEAAYIKEHYALPGSPDEIKAGFLRIMEEFYKQEATLKPGVRSFLEKLDAMGIPMVIATSSSRKNIADAMKRLEIDRYFSRIFTCEEAGAGKREPAVFLLAAEYLGLSPRETCVFEDVIHAIRSANSAGFITVGVYDKASAADNAAMKKECSIYLHDLTNIDDFLSRI